MTSIFWTCATLIVISQVMILRSTFRARRAGTAQAPGTRQGPLEWAFAVVPALALVVLLVFTWLAAR